MKIQASNRIAVVAGKDVDAAASTLMRHFTSKLGRHHRANQLGDSSSTNYKGGAIEWDFPIDGSRRGVLFLSAGGADDQEAYVRISVGVISTKRRGDQTTASVIGTDPKKLLQSIQVELRNVFGLKMGKTLAQTIGV